MKIEASEKEKIDIYNLEKCEWIVREGKGKLRMKTRQIRKERNMNVDNFSWDFCKKEKKKIGSNRSEKDQRKQ